MGNVVHGRKLKFPIPHILLVEGALYYERDTKFQEPNSLFFSRGSAVFFQSRQYCITSILCNSHFFKKKIGHSATSDTRVTVVYIYNCHYKYLWFAGYNFTVSHSCTVQLCGAAQRCVRTAPPRSAEPRAASGAAAC